MISLPGNYSTTMLIIKDMPKLRSAPEDKLTSILFLPENTERQGEGGLRTKGYFKQSYKNKPLVTVVTVVFNGEEHLEETIKSVIGQAYDNVEYIIIDGGSSDATLNIIKKYEDQIDYWVSEKDGGIYDAMNKAVMLATGKWINFMNAGDSFRQPNSIKLLIKATMKSYGDIFFGHTEYVYTKDHSKIIFAAYFKKKDFGMPFCHQSSLIKMSLHKKYPYDLSYKIGADYDFFFLLNHLGKKYVLVDEVISNFALGGLSSMMTPSHRRERKEVLLKYHSGRMFCLRLFVWEKIRLAKYYIKKIPFATKMYHRMICLLKF